MAPKKKINLKELILRLLSEKKEISIHEVAKAAATSMLVPADRRAIQRAFKELIENKVILSHGKARARTYSSLKLHSLKLQETPIQANATTAFKDIPLSQEAKNLLNYVSQSLQTRKPIAYNQEFLRSYEPNRSYYLTEAQCSQLADIGRIENKPQPAGTHARHILNRLLIDLSWNSSRLEGNTYSLLETKRLIELGENAVGKNASEAQMILNHKAGIEYIIEGAADKKISSHKVCSIHALLSENLLGDPGASGRIREIAVGVGGSTYMPLENPHVLKDCFQVFIEKLNFIKNPFEQSFFSLVHLSYMQAFEDVNKRTARLVANISLIKENLNPLSFADIEKEAYAKSLIGIYEKNDVSLLRDLYMWAYERSSQKYSAIQQAMGEPNLLKLKYRTAIQNVIRAVILEKVPGPEVVNRIQNLLETQDIEQQDRAELFKLIEIEIMSLHDGNIARFKIRPSEFEKWKDLQ